MNQQHDEYPRDEADGAKAQRMLERAWLVAETNETIRRSHEYEHRRQKDKREIDYTVHC